MAVAGTKGAAVEVNSETDFVAKNDQFQAFVKTVSGIALETGDDVEALRSASYPGGGTVGDALTANIATIGENQALRRVRVLTVSNGAVVPYVHNQVAPGMGKIGVLVALESDAGVDVLEPLGKQIAMHIAASFPQALHADHLDADTIERERAIAREKAAESGKPENIIEKMVEGAVAKFKKEAALLSQLFVMDNKTPVQDVVAKAAKDAGTSIVLKDYVRFQLGEGIERETSDFAAEVARPLASRRKRSHKRPPGAVGLRGWRAPFLCGDFRSVRYRIERKSRCARRERRWHAFSTSGLDFARPCARSERTQGERVRDC